MYAGVYVISAAGTSCLNAHELKPLCSRPHCQVLTSSGSSRRFLYGSPLPAVPFVRRRISAHAKRRDGTDESDASRDSDDSVMVALTGIAWAPVSLSLFGFGFVLGMRPDASRQLMHQLTAIEDIHRAIFREPPPQDEAACFYYR